MAPSTILRSIAFSRATASAICRSSSLLALTVAIVSISLALVRRRPGRGVHAPPAIRRLAALLFAPPKRLRNERIGEDKSCFHDVVDPQQSFRPFRRPRLLAADAYARTLAAH